MVLLITMAIFAAAAGWYGWHQRDELVKPGSFRQPVRPEGVSRSDHTRTVSRWRRRRQLSWVFLYAFCGAMLAFVLVVFIRGAAGLLGG